MTFYGGFVMEQYKQEFIEFMVDSQVLKFGEFTLKSGRKSPFFMNAGGYVTGSQLKKLGEYYAKAPSMQNTAMILMSFSDLHIREFLSVLLLLLPSANYMAKRSVTALTVRKRRIMVQTREVSLEAS